MTPMGTCFGWMIITWNPGIFLYFLINCRDPGSSYRIWYIWSPYAVWSFVYLLLFIFSSLFSSSHPTPVPPLRTYILTPCFCSPPRVLVSFITDSHSFILFVFCPYLFTFSLETPFLHLQTTSIWAFPLLFYLVAYFKKLYLAALVWSILNTCSNHSNLFLISATKDFYITLPVLG
jgi:hypothetical protein